MSLSACKEVEEESAAGYEPAKLEPIKGKSEDFQRVTFTKEGAARVDLQTGTVSRSGGHKVIPYEALIYNDEAKTFVYTSPKPLSYERVPVTVDRIDGRACVAVEGAGRRHQGRDCWCDRGVRRRAGHRWKPLRAGG